MTQSALDVHLQALELLSPMPDDDAPEMTADRLDRYDELVGAIARELDGRFEARAVAALIYSFGPGDGFETYWSALHVIERFRTEEETYALIRAGISNEAPGVRKWCCLLLGRLRDPNDLPLFIALLGNSEERVVVQALASIRMLAQVHPVQAAISFVIELVADPRAKVAAAAQHTLQALRAANDAAI